MAQPMSGRTALSLLLLATPGCARYPMRDAVLEAGMAATLAVDMFQSRTATAWCTEANPIIGHCGERVPVVPYFIATAIAHAVVSAVIPRGWARTVFQAGPLGFEVHTIYRNSLTEHTVRGQ